jgi:hypothetical protein
MLYIIKCILATTIGGFIIGSLVYTIFFVICLSGYFLYNYFFADNPVEIEQSRFINKRMGDLYIVFVVLSMIYLIIKISTEGSRFLDSL